MPIVCHLHKYSSVKFHVTELYYTRHSRSRISSVEFYRVQNYCTCYVTDIVATTIQATLYSLQLLRRLLQLFAW